MISTRANSPKLERRLTPTVWQWGLKANAYFAWRASPSFLIGISLYRPHWGVDRLCAVEGTLHETRVHDSDIDPEEICIHCGVRAGDLALYWDSALPSTLTEALEPQLHHQDPLTAAITAATWAEHLKLVVEDLLTYPWEDHTLAFHDTRWPAALHTRAKTFALDGLAISA